MSGSTTQLNLPHNVKIYYHPIDDETVRRGIEIFGGCNPLEMRLYHIHPTATETTELVTRLLVKGNFSEAAKIIDTVQTCSDCIALSTRREGSLAGSDAAAIKKIAKDDSKLHLMLLTLYQKALCKSLLAEKDS